MFFNAFTVGNLLKMTFEMSQPQCAAEDTTPYDNEMPALLARGGHPLSDYAPPSVREELNHTITLEDQMLPLVVASVGILMAYGLGRAVDYYQNRKPLISSSVFNAKNDNNKKHPNDGPAASQNSRLC